MARISAGLSFPKTILNSALKMAARLNPRGRLASRVRMGDAPPPLLLRRATQSRARRPFIARSLFSRKVRQPAESSRRAGVNHKLTGKNGAQDGRQLLTLLSRSNPESLLRAVHESAVNPDIEQDNALHYQADLYQSFQKEAAQMSDGDLLKLVGRLHGKKMMELRGALKLAAQQGAGRGADSEGVRKELNFTSQNLEGLTRTLLAEAGLRRSLIHDLPSSPPPPPLTNKSGHKSAMNILHRFGQEMAPRVSSSSGDVPAPLHDRIQDDFVGLAREAEADLPDEINGKEGGICYLDPKDSSSEELNVPNIYIKDFARLPKIFDDGKNITNNVELGWNQSDRKEISDHITQFCQGNANQARRVSVLMTQQSAASLYKLHRSGELAPHPEIGSGPYSGASGFEGGKQLSMQIKRLENGDIRIRTHQKFEPFMFNQMLDDGRMMTYPVGDKKSFLSLDLEVIVPYQQSAAPQVKSFHHASHIMIEQPVAELP